MIVGVLGVLKAGGAYLPLDSNYPIRAIAAYGQRRRSFDFDYAGKSEIESVGIC
jgi:hypothetical protein